MASHEPVLLEAVLDSLVTRPDGRYLDGTFGRGGHSAGILNRLSAAGRLLALDKDIQAVDHGKATLGNDPRFQIEHGGFEHLGDHARVWLRGTGAKLDGILLDLGVSSPQLDSAARGFSFNRSGPLDMRLDTTRGPTLAQWLAEVDERTLASVIREFGEERQATRIARSILEAQAQGRLETTADLAAAVAAVKRGGPRKRHPATRVFQALRIAINQELVALSKGLEAAVEWLSPGGRLCVISFHSLEDRIAKRFLRDASREAAAYAGLPDVPPQARAKLKLCGRAVRPSATEVETNPRARSAILRVAERLSDA